MANAQRKKARELAHVHAFLRNSRLDARIADDDRETPDFLLEFEGRSVGLEVTEVFVAENNPRAATKANESARSEIIERAERAYNVRGGKPLQLVTFQFALRADLRTVRRIEAAAAIADFLVDADPDEGRTEYDRRTSAFNRVPPFLLSITTLYEPGAAYFQWWAPRTGWVSPTSSEALQPYIDPKAAKLATYRDVVRENWLLLVIGGRDPSQLFEPSAEPPTVVSPFDRTYLHFGFEGRVQLLPTRHVEESVELSPVTRSRRRLVAE